jgi:ATP-dependent Zn protease
MADINWIDVLTNWFPMLLLIAVWVVFIPTIRKSGKHQAEHRELMRRQADALERIAAALEKRV